MESGTLADWTQAVGTLLALAIAIYVPVKLDRNKLRRENEVDLQRVRTLIYGHGDVMKELLDFAARVDVADRLMHRPDFVDSQEWIHAVGIIDVARWRSVTELREPLRHIGTPDALGLLMLISGTEQICEFETDHAAAPRPCAVYLRKCRAGAASVQITRRLVIRMLGLQPPPPAPQPAPPKGLENIGHRRALFQRKDRN
jgi:hypothetical protein